MECPICFEEKELATLDCDHKVCSMCIIKWASENATCPICRCDIDITSETFRRVINEIDHNGLLYLLRRVQRELEESELAQERRINRERRRGERIRQRRERIRRENIFYCIGD